MPMLFSPTIGAAIAARYWFLWMRCPACRTIDAVNLRTLDPSPRRSGDHSHSHTLVPLVPTECTVRRARATIANSIADEMREEHRRRVLGE